jgi:release factor glutamine methyltransferase
VDLALTAIDARPAGCHFVDVGTGSGALAVTLLAERADVRGVATDIDPNALSIARQNAQRHNVRHRLHLVASSLVDALENRFPLVIANLPYVPTARLADLDPEVTCFEPRVALDGGPDGTEVIGDLLQALPRILTADGVALLEIDESHGAALQARARTAVPGSSVRVERDARGNDRYLVIERGVS